MVRRKRERETVCCERKKREQEKSGREIKIKLDLARSSNPPMGLQAWATRLLRPNRKLDKERQTADRKRLHSSRLGRMMGKFDDDGDDDDGGGRRRRM